ncbi:MAG: four helix bundle protein [Nostocaceae cyanobacterium]|nr:four helix bundle protein [Nostocaceae cyanobacterium]
MTDFRQLKEWDKAHELTVAVYKTTREFPESEILGLTQQIRLACSTIPIKIAQGSHKDEKQEQVDFLNLALDATIEVEYLLLLCYEMEYLQISDYDRLVSSVVEVKEVLEVAIAKLKNTNF